MFVTRCAFSPIGANDWIVKGQIAIEGEFTQGEWNLIKETFIALGLFQNYRGIPKPSELVPTRAECIDALMADARGEGGSDKLRKKYNIPPDFKLPQDLARLLAMNMERYTNKQAQRLENLIEDHDQSKE
jgi:hypothetical protein